MVKTYERPICSECGRPLHGMKQFEGFMSCLLACCFKVAKTQPIRWKRKMSDQKSVYIFEDVKDCVLAKDIKGIKPEYYARIADLKYWGLLSQRREWNHQGIYQITDLARRFISGSYSIPRKVYVAKGYLLRESQETITFKHAIGKRYNEVEDWIIDWIMQEDTTGQRRFI